MQKKLLKVARINEEIVQTLHTALQNLKLDEYDSDLDYLNQSLRDHGLIAEHIYAGN